MGFWGFVVTIYIVAVILMGIDMLSGYTDKKRRYDPKRKRDETEDLRDRREEKEDE